MILAYTVKATSYFIDNFVFMFVPISLELFIGASWIKEEIKFISANQNGIIKLFVRSYNSIYSRSVVPY